LKAFVASPLDEATSGATARHLEKYTAALPEGSSAAREAALDPRALWVRVCIFMFYLEIHKGVHHFRIEPLVVCVYTTDL